MITRIIRKVRFNGAFFGVVVIAYGILGVLDFDLLSSSLSSLARSIARIAPILLLVFGVMFLANLFFEGSRIVRFLGKGSGFRGWVVAITGGIASSGPIYMWYPLLSDLKEKGMKDSLVAATGKDKNSDVSPRSGRSRFYLIFDGNRNMLEVISNPFSRGGGGAGFGVAKMLADKDVDIVIGSQIGGHMEESLKSRGLKYYEMTGSAKVAVERIIAQEKR